MCNKNLSKKSLSLFIPCMLLLCVTTTIHAKQELDHSNVIVTDQWVDSRKAVFTGAPILIHLRTGHERALRMPEATRLSDAQHQSPSYDLDISGEVVRFSPTAHFDRESITLIGLETGTAFVLRVRASAFGIRQPMQIFHNE